MSKKKPVKNTKNKPVRKKPVKKKITKKKPVRKKQIKSGTKTKNKYDISNLDSYNCEKKGIFFGCGLINRKYPELVYFNSEGKEEPYCCHEGTNNLIDSSSNKITDSDSPQFDNLILQITNTDGLKFTGNTITNSGTFPQLNPQNPAIKINASKSIKFKNNKYKGKATKIIETDNESQKTFN